MSDKLARKVIYFGKRDSDLWDAVSRLPKGDQNYHMKQALRAYFLGETAGRIPAPIPAPVVQPPKAAEDDVSDRIDFGRLVGGGGLME